MTEDVEGQYAEHDECHNNDGYTDPEHHAPKCRALSCAARMDELTEAVAPTEFPYVTAA